MFTPVFAAIKFQKERKMKHCGLVSIFVRWMKNEARLRLDIKVFLSRVELKIYDFKKNSVF